MLAGACSFSARLDGAPPEAGMPEDARAIDAPADARAIDAPMPGVCALTDCVTRGGICLVDNTCFIDTGASSVTCPDGVPCQVVCNSDNACQDDVDCGAATSCHVTCRANNACKGGVTCGGSPCEVVCDGRDMDHSNVCEGMITSSPGSACEVHCCGSASNLCAGGASAHCTEDMVCP